jgi:hypothetical protein
MTQDPLEDLVKEAESWKVADPPRDHREAVAWARGVFKRLNEKGAFEAGNDTKAFLLDNTYRLALCDPDQYIGLAVKDPIWFKGLKWVTAEILKRNDEMPRQLAHWVADVLTGATKEPKPARGRPMTTVHHATVWVTVSQLVTWKWTATRNDASAALSACDVVADATGLTFDRVKDIAEKTWRQPRYFLREWDYPRTRKIMGINLP